MKLMRDESIELALGDEQRIQDALEALTQDPHAPRSLTVTFNLHVHNEYPKCVGDQIVNNEQQEEAALAAIEAAKPQEPAASQEPAPLATVTPITPVTPITTVAPVEPVAPTDDDTDDPNAEDE
jgi:hypothetical protein